MRWFILLVISLALIAGGCGDKHNETQHETHDIHWTYTGKTGPAHWGELKDDYKMCKTGKKQSPINIVSGDAVKGEEQRAITLDYKECGLDIVNNGHTIQCNYPEGSTLTVAGVTYKLLQFHFHHPSEHTLEGNATAMEVHFVHKNDQGELGVLGIFIKEGKKNETFDQIWQNMPEKADGTFQKAEVKIDAGKIVPPNLAYYNYSGSLTTPPCSEGVNWMVLKQHLEASKEQVDKFKKVIGENARPVQPLNDRKVTSY